MLYPIEGYINMNSRCNLQVGMFLFPLNELIVVATFYLYLYMDFELLIFLNSVAIILVMHTVLDFFSDLNLHV